MKRIRLAPSILAADFTRLGAQINEVERAGAEYLHIDVMDGHFVSNISVGPPVISAVRHVTDLTIDAHLMIENPLRFINDYIRAGADIISIHVEACDPGPVIKAIKAGGKKAGLTIKPGTPPETVYPFIEELELVLVMSVEPGAGGQRMIPGCLNKAEILANYIEKYGLETELEMDGGIYLTNVRKAIESGANIIVAGSAIFGTPEPGAAVSAFMDIFKSYGIN
ncbi:MAG: ribulose-phosphate 3-epimerase [Clostridiales bacterium]|jgi:ribulose-phosphate 3-epimerase|nr:ribulose-phosphate 3-epimerase [Clostridiales bacterium]